MDGTDVTNSFFLNDQFEMLAVSPPTLLQAIRQRLVSTIFYSLVEKLSHINNLGG